jgi:hypothetical protein
MVGNWPPRRFLFLFQAFMKRDSVFIATQGTGRLSRRFGTSVDVVGSPITAPDLAIVSSESADTSADDWLPRQTSPLAALPIAFGASVNMRGTSSFKSVVDIAPVTS